MFINRKKLMVVACCVIALCAAAVAEYSWQNSYATVQPQGDLEYTPQPFVYTPGASIIYIDYDNGSDANNGTTKQTPFKHHPWDANATGNAKTTTGTHTYVFKRGVVYRGRLVAKESGASASNPIILTSDPSWGTGFAGIFGSERITSGWKKATAADAPNIPDPSKVWYIDLPFTVEDNPYDSFGRGEWPNISVQNVVEVTPEGLVAVDIAKAPNFTWQEEDHPVDNFYILTKGSQTGIKILTDQLALAPTSAEPWIGGTVWKTWGKQVGATANMGTLHASQINSYAGGIAVLPFLRHQAHEVDPGARYYLENMPHLLDAPNEFYHMVKGGFNNRLFIRLSGDRDPNAAIIEVAIRPDIVDIEDQSNIEISGLTFCANNQPRPGIFIPGTNETWQPPHYNNSDGTCQAIELTGNVKNVTIKNNSFEHVIMGIASKRAERNYTNFFRNIQVLDNVFTRIHDQAICLGKPGTYSELTWIKKGRGYVQEVKILRNRLHYIGYRQIASGFSAMPALSFRLGNSAEIAGNFITYAFGQGIDVRGESPKINGNGKQIKILVHHNKVEYSLLATNDWGGIESWYAGPLWVFSNISKYPGGRRFHLKDGSDACNWGFSFYVDHGHQHRVFNNIAVGKYNHLTDYTKRSPIAFMQAAAYRASYMNNSAYRFYRGSMMVSGRETQMVGNLYGNMSKWTESVSVRGESPEYLRDAYAKNVYQEGYAEFTGRHGANSIPDLQNKLKTEGGMVSSVGMTTAGEVFQNPAAGDFRPQGDAIGNGARIFLPWNLQNDAGRFHFHLNEDNPALVYGVNGGYTTEPQKETILPEVHLSVAGATPSDYVMGGLEDWCKGALQFNGTLFGSVQENANFDPGNGSFILETYFRTSATGPILSKGGVGGYMLYVTTDGAVAFVVKNYTMKSSVTVNDGNFHHVVAQFDAAAGKTSIWVDGQLRSGATSGDLPASASSSAPFYVGRNGTTYFKGVVDFVRVALSSFTESMTSFDELYTWNFEGPAQRDFCGTKITGKRDAGALQFNTHQSDVKFAVRPRAPLATVKAAGSFIRVRFGAALPAESKVTVRVFDLGGRAVTIVSGKAKRVVNNSAVRIDSRAWARGQYLVQVKAPGVTIAKMVQLVL